MERSESAPNPDLAARIERHEQALRRFVSFQAATIVRRRESLSDLVQTVFRELLVAGARLHFERDTQFRNWLFVTARNKLRDRLKYHLRARRDARREERVSDPRELDDIWRDAVATFCTPATAAVSQEEIARIERCFQSLSEEHREVILLSRLGNQSAAEIGALIGRGEGATRALLSRALARLSELLQEE